MKSKKCALKEKTQGYPVLSVCGFCGNSHRFFCGYGMDMGLEMRFPRRPWKCHRSSSVAVLIGEIHQEYKHRSEDSEVSHSAGPQLPCVTVAFQWTRSGRRYILPWNCMYATHGRPIVMSQMSVRPSFYPSVHLSVRLSNSWIVTKRNKFVPTFLHHMKDHLS